MSVQPQVRGWCPTAYRPMMSGDGLLVRVRPPMARVTCEQMRGLCALAQRHGNGLIDVTSRANLQIRGVREDAHAALLESLCALGLLGTNAIVDAKRAFLVSPANDEDGLTNRVYERLFEASQGFPDLPPKIGIALDTGVAPVLSDVPADFRIERGAVAPLILRADGAETGMPVDETSLPDDLIRLMSWFNAKRGSDIRRMKTLLENQQLPPEFQGFAPARSAPAWMPGLQSDGIVLAVPFGQFQACEMISLLDAGNGDHIRITPWRSIFLPGTGTTVPGFISDPDDPLLNVVACPGAPACAQGEMETRTLARTLANATSDGQLLHVSGCAKGCAHRYPSAFTVVGRSGGYDLVKNGTAWDEPKFCNLTPTDIDREIRL